MKQGCDDLHLDVAVAHGIDGPHTLADAAAARGR